MAVMVERLEGGRQKLLLEVTSLASIVISSKEKHFFFVNAILVPSPLLKLDCFGRLIHNLQR